METVFSGDIEKNHYRPWNVIDLTYIDDVPPPINESTGQVLAFDLNMPDAMIVRFKDDDGLE